MGGRLTAAALRWTAACLLRGISLARGNFGDAALSLAAMVPFAGAAATAGKFAKKAGKFIAKNLDKTDAVAAGVKNLGKNAGDAAKSGSKGGGSSLGKQSAKSPCFPAGTPILTPHGPVAIEDIRAGDWVLSRDEFDETGEVAPRLVEEKFIRYGEIYELRIGGQVIRITDGHPVYIEGRGWTSVCEVVAGDCLSVVRKFGRTRMAGTSSGGRWESRYKWRRGRRLRLPASVAMGATYSPLRALRQRDRIKACHCL